MWVFPLEKLHYTGAPGLCEGPSDEESPALWPEVGSRMMARLVTGEDMAGEWVVVQEGIYRYSVQHAGRLRVRSILSEYLATEVQWKD